METFKTSDAGKIKALPAHRLGIDGEAWLRGLPASTFRLIDEPVSDRDGS